MPTPAIIAGLVMAAVLGTGILALGAYTVHRYMKWRCREFVGLFQHNPVRVVKIDDLESRGKSRRTRRDGEERTRSPATEQMPQHLTRQQGNDVNQQMTVLREGFDLEGGPEWEQPRRIHRQTLMPAPIHAQPGAHRQALEWHQPGAGNEQFWQAPAVFQQQPPQGGWHACIPPRPDVGLAYGLPMLDPQRPQRIEKQLKQERTSRVNGNQTTRARRLDPATALLCRALIQPISSEGDGIELVDGYPFVAEGVVHSKRQDRRKKKRTRKAEQRRQSSSTELGTCSSNHSATSAEDIPQDHIPEGCPRRICLPPHSCSPYQDYPQQTARAEGCGNPCARQSYRGRSSDNETTAQVQT